MRSPNPAILSRLCASLAESSVSPLRTRQRPSSCLLCAYQIPLQPLSRRHQSTSQSTTREDTNPRPQTHYTFFPTTLPSGPPPHGHFTIDLSSLKKEFLQLQSRAHPDLHPAENKNKAQALSARINEAYKTLQSPLLRAQYLLSLRGIDVAEDETAKIEDPELLMEVLEVQEQIEEAESEKDLDGMKRHNDGRIEESVGRLEEAFRNDDVGLAKSEAVRLRYWINIKESLDGWERGKPISLEH
ncbi:Co-chaperone Hsc20 [Melanomma pulvis-pyrius CBS 109.77]|uniref:Co-chaperone Hsc20 n=1 Tax=Melanomma pulvis-pyrius CBS 109.77 TaxID=1314802 RepID=A0A6A6XTV8_9PLEO|nr:Co-chaperone Hsc20 [Melanomma pulvis-pyrius CBS 109.77]